MLPLLGVGLLLMGIVIGNQGSDPVAQGVEIESQYRV
jgi:hypothetical protein